MERRGRNGPGLAVIDDGEIAVVERNKDRIVPFKRQVETFKTDLVCLNQTLDLRFGHQIVVESQDDICLGLVTLEAKP